MTVHPDPIAEWEERRGWIEGALVRYRREALAAGDRLRDALASEREQRQLFHDLGTIAAAERDAEREAHQQTRGDADAAVAVAQDWRLRIETMYDAEREAHQVTRRALQTVDWWLALRTEGGPNEASLDDLGYFLDDALVGLPEPRIPAQEETEREQINSGEPRGEEKP